MPSWPATPHPGEAQIDLRSRDCYTYLGNGATRILGSGSCSRSRKRDPNLPHGLRTRHLFRKQLIASRMEEERNPTLTHSSNSPRPIELSRTLILLPLINPSSASHVPVPYFPGTVVSRPPRPVLAVTALAHAGPDSVPRGRIWQEVNLATRFPLWGPEGHGKHVGVSGPFPFFPGWTGGREPIARDTVLLGAAPPCCCSTLGSSRPGSLAGRPVHEIFAGRHPLHVCFCLCKTYGLRTSHMIVIKSQIPQPVFTHHQ